MDFVYAVLVLILYYLLFYCLCRSLFYKDPDLLFKCCSCIMAFVFTAVPLYDVDYMSYFFYWCALYVGKVVYYAPEEV